MILKILKFSPEVIILVVSILLITFGFLNINISPAPDNLNNLTSSFSHSYVLPITRLDKNYEEKYIRTTINNGYRLMVVSIVGGFVLLLLDIILIWIKYPQVFVTHQVKFT